MERRFPRYEGPAEELRRQLTRVGTELPDGHCQLRLYIPGGLGSHCSVLSTQFAAQRSDIIGVWQYIWRHWLGSSRDIADGDSFHVRSGYSRILGSISR